MYLKQSTAKLIEEFMKKDNVSLNISDEAILFESNNEQQLMNDLERNRLESALLCLRFEINRRYNLIRQIITADCNSDKLQMAELIKEYKESIKESQFPESNMDELLENFLKLYKAYEI